MLTQTQAEIAPQYMFTAHAFADNNPNNQLVRLQATNAILTTASGGSLPNIWLTHERLHTDPAHFREGSYDVFMTTTGEILTQQIDTTQQENYGFNIRQNPGLSSRIDGYSYLCGGRVIPGEWDPKTGRARVKTTNLLTFSPTRGIMRERRIEEGQPVEFELTTPKYCAVQHDAEAKPEHKPLGLHVSPDGQVGLRLSLCNLCSQGLSIYGGRCPLGVFEADKVYEHMIPRQ